MTEWEVKYVVSGYDLCLQDGLPRGIGMHDCRYIF